MYLLYLDDSGSVKNAADSHIVLAGLALFERQVHWHVQRLDALAATLWPDNPDSLEFRGNAIVAGRKHWRGVKKDERIRALETALKLLNDSHHVVLFGAAIHKATVSPDDPVELAFEQLANRFDRYLGRLHKAGRTHRGLIVLDESSYETSIQSLARDFRKKGHKWGKLYNMADVPFFVDSVATRTIQFADLVAYAVGRFYNAGNSKYFDIISGRFDREGGVLHGLTHRAPTDPPCACYACSGGKP